MKGSRRVHHAGACLLFVLEAVVLTWPLALRLTGSVPGVGAGDNVAFLWNFWWMRHSREIGASFFRTNYLFFPYGTDLVLHTHTALNAFVGATILGGLQIASAQNVVILASYALNGISVYALAWTTTRQISAAFTAGFVFMAAPFFSAHLHGHFNLVSAWFIPLYVMALLSALERQSVARAVLAGAILAVGVYSDYYYVVFLIAFTVWAVAYRWLDASLRWEPSGRRPLARVDRLLGVAAVLLALVALWVRFLGGGEFSIATARISMTSDFNARVALWPVLLVLVWRRLGLRARFSLAPDASRKADVFVLCAVLAALTVAAAPVLARVLNLWVHGDYVSQRYDWRSGPGGIDALSLIAGNPFHPVWGMLVRRWYAAWRVDLIENTAWVGVAPIAAVVIISRARRVPDVARFWAGVAGIFVCWALGPSLLVAGRQVALWLPELLMRFVPIAANARIPGRAMVMAYLALAMLCAVSVSMMPRDRSRQAAAGLCVAAFIDFIAAPFPLFRLDRPEVYTQLALAPPGAILELPIGLRDGYGMTGSLDPATLLYQTVHERPMAGGFVARLPPSVRREHEASPVLQALLSLSAGLQPPNPPDREMCRRFFREHGFRFVVFNARLSPPGLRDYVARALPIRLVTSADERQLYEIE